MVASPAAATHVAAISSQELRNVVMAITLPAALCRQRDLSDDQPAAMNLVSRCAPTEPETGYSIFLDDWITAP